MIRFGFAFFTVWGIELERGVDLQLVVEGVIMWFLERERGVFNFGMGRFDVQDCFFVLFNRIIFLKFLKYFLGMRRQELNKFFKRKMIQGLKEIRIIDECVRIRKDVKGILKVKSELLIYMYSMILFLFLKVYIK